MAQQPIAEVINDAVNETSNGQINSSNYSLETMVLLINADRLKRLETKVTNEFIELKKRQDNVTFLHKLIKGINAATVDDEFDCNNHQDLKDLLAKAKEHGVDINLDKSHYNKQERDRLIENIRITADDFNIINDMQLQTITRLTTERYESYQLARSIIKPHHEDKVNKARAIAGK